MKISIIIPSYRQPQFLGRAIESCLEQDHDDLEVIVVEDRSRDASLGLALSYAKVDDRVTVIECAENGGLGKARNIGIGQATGEYLCFLDSDDYLLDQSISTRVAALPDAISTHGHKVVGTYGDWQHVAESINHPRVRQPRASMPLVNASTYTGENVFICSAPLVRRTAVLEAGGFPEGLRMLEDFALWARMIAMGGIFVPVHHVVSTYRQRPNSMLRGNGVVVMSDHVEVINNWMAESGTPLADSGALSAWLANSAPYSHGRMSWNVPSVLGSFGGAPGAHAVHTNDLHSPQSARPSTVEDFMSSPESTGLTQPVSPWATKSNDSPSTVLIISTLAQSLQAIGIADSATDPTSVAMMSTQPNDWTSTWPLALAGYGVRHIDELPQLSPQTVIDLDDADHPLVAQRNALASTAVGRLWPSSAEPHGSIVYVPNVLDGYPALDAWISVALHSLADAGLEPTVMADPAIRSNLGGYRSEVISIDRLRSATMVVMPAGAHTGLIEPITRSVVFDPSTHGDHAQTAEELGHRLRAELDR